VTAAQRPDARAHRDALKGTQLPLMLVDANLPLYAVDSSSAFHRPASTWLESALNGAQRVALPWQSLTAFRRISTNPRAWDHP